MRIGFFGDGPWADLTLEHIAAMGEVPVAFVCARHGAPDPAMRRWAEKLGVPFLAPADVNAPEVVGRIADYGADLHVSMSFDQILRSEILGAARLGFINCHAGALPFYRGRNPLNWAIINGEDRFGVTVHHVDLGIDTGDIIVQRFANIAIDDTYATVLAKAHELCASALCDAIRQIADGTATRMPQSDIHPVGFYCGRRGPGDEWIDWTWPSVRVHNFIRGIALPGPCARTYCRARPIAVLRAVLIDGAPDYIGTVGEVVGRDDAGVVVKTGDATLRLLEVAEIEGDGGLGTPSRPKLPIGTRLGKAPLPGSTPESPK